MRRNLKHVMVTATLALAALAVPAETGPSPVEPRVLELRETAWRAWFAGDEATLRRLLPPDFIGIDMGDAPLNGLERTIEDARAFAAGGGRLIRLEFPETRAQVHGDVVVLYGRFRVVLEQDGRESTFAGRLTEVFVRRDGDWVHPGWHLDLASTP
jgi:hypothetical protein